MLSRKWKVILRTLAFLILLLGIYLWGFSNGVENYHKRAIFSKGVSAIYHLNEIKQDEISHTKIKTMRFIMELNIDSAIYSYHKIEKNYSILPRLFFPDDNIEKELDLLIKYRKAVPKKYNSDWAKEIRTDNLKWKNSVIKNSEEMEKVIEQTINLQ